MQQLSLLCSSVLFNSSDTKSNKIKANKQHQEPKKITYLYSDIKNKIKNKKKKKKCISNATNVLMIHA